MIMKKVVLLCCAVLMFTAGCTYSPSEPEEVVISAEPGEFGLSYMRGLGKTSEGMRIQHGGSAYFNLGDIKGSTSFFFLLYNIGSRPITDVTLSISNSDFAVYPSRMDSLLPESEIGILPIIKLSAFHGTMLDGAGTRPLMPMGENKVTLEIRGKTKTRKHVDTLLVMKAEMDLNALLLDAEFIASGEAIDLSKSEGYNLGVPELGINGNVHFYMIPSCSLTIKNTGNVNAMIDLYYHTMSYGGFFDTVHYDMSVGEEVTFPMLNGEVTVSINGNNTISDPKKFAPFSDGKCYLKFDGSANQCENPINIEYFMALIANKFQMCDSVINRLFIIDNRFVLWTYKGSCTDQFKEGYYLFDRIPSMLLASIKINQAKEITSDYKEQMYYQSLVLMRNNISEPDLGLGGSIVEEIALE